MKSRLPSDELAGILHATAGMSFPGSRPYPNGNTYSGSTGRVLARLYTISDARLCLHPVHESNLLLSGVLGAVS